MSFPLILFAGRKAAPLGPPPPPPPAPVAGFTASPLSGDAPLVVTVADSATGVISSRAYHKNDGGGWVAFANTTEINPVESLAAGTHSLRQTVTGPGGSDALTRTDYVVASPPPPPPPVFPTAGLVRLFHLDEASGQRGDEAGSGLGLGGTPGEAATAAGNVHALAFQGDGTNFLTGDRSGVPTGGDAVTVQADVHLDGFGTADVYPVAVCWGDFFDPTPGRFTSLAVYFNGTSAYFVGGGGFQPGISGTTAISTGVWYRVAIVYDAVEGEWSIYLNGALDGVGAQVKDTSTEGTFNVGFDGGGEPLAGRVGDVAVWGRDLSAADVAAAYAAID